MTFFLSVAAFFVTITSGLLLERFYGVDLLFRSSITALSLMTIAPWLYADGRRLARKFLETHRENQLGEERYEILRGDFELWMKSSARWVISVACSVAATSVVAAVIYPEATGAARLWVFASFGALFLVAFRGYWALVVMIRLINRFSTIGVRFNPYHPDLFGGVGEVGTFAVRSALYFSSGALILPLAFEAVTIAQPRDAAMSVLAYLLTAGFIAAVIIAFVAPVLDIKAFVDRERARVTVEGRNKLEKLMEEYRSKSEHDEHLARQIEFCHLMECAELAKLRDYPYDVKVISELLLAVAFPVGLIVLETYIRN